MQWPTIIIVNIFSVTLFSYLDPPTPQGFLSNFYNDPTIIIVNTFSIKFIKCEQRKKTANKASKQGLPTNIVNNTCQFRGRGGGGGVGGGGGASFGVVRTPPPLGGFCYKLMI